MAHWRAEDSDMTFQFPDGRDLGERKKRPRDGACYRFITSSGVEKKTTDCPEVGEAKTMTTNHQISLTYLCTS